MVYSYNQEFGTINTEPYSVNQAGRAEQLWYEMKQLPPLRNLMGSYASNTPRELVQLQAADMLAFELCCEFENRIRRPDDDMRYGLRQIVSMVKSQLPKIQLLDRKELLRIVRAAGFADQTGVEEIDNLQYISLCNP